MTATPGSRELLPHVRELLKAVRLMKQQLAPQMTAVPPGSLGVLTAIAAGATHVRDLAVENALDPSTISRAVAALVRAGLVERTADPDDGRASVLTVSATGRAVLESVMTCYDNRLAAALADWTPEELHTFSALLQRFTADLLTVTESTVPNHKPTLEAAR